MNIVYNQGLGFTSVSLVYNINSSNNEKQDYLNLKNNDDIIIFGIFNEESLEKLKWLTPRLIAEGKLVSVIYNVKELKTVNITCLRKILLVDSSSVESDLNLRKDDIIVITDKSIKALLGTLNRINVEVSKIMFDSSKIDKDELIKKVQLYPVELDKIL